MKGIKGVSLMGAHRTGKTTLAKTYAGNREIKFIDMSVAPAYIECGIPMGPVTDFADRMVIQDAACKIYKNLLEDLTCEFITDRCFLDLVAYALIDFPQNPTKFESAWLINYIDKCRKLNQQYFSTVVLLRPAIELVPEGTSWSSSLGVVSQIDAGMLWAADMAGKVRKMPKYITKLDSRVSHLEVIVNESQL
jgi:hypothetical protein